jgi:hypothetical protein
MKIIATVNYYQTLGARDLCHGLKEGDSAAIAIVATRMALYLAMLPSDSVLIPIPSHPITYRPCNCYVVISRTIGKAIRFASRKYYQRQQSRTTLHHQTKRHNALLIGIIKMLPTKMD